MIVLRSLRAHDDAMILPMGRGDCLPERLGSFDEGAAVAGLTFLIERTTRGLVSGENGWQKVSRWRWSYCAGTTGCVRYLDMSEARSDQRGMA